MTKQIKPYGSWRSSITADLIVAGTVGLSQVVLDGQKAYWVEGRPAEAGRNVVVRRTNDGSIEDVTPAEHNVRTRVHEYGGAAYTVDDDDVYYVDFRSQQLYRRRPRESAVPLTAQGVDRRYADFVVDNPNKRLISVREDHSCDRNNEAVNEIVSIPMDPESGAVEQVLVTGSDFYSNPRVSPDGTQLCWLQWDHPNMPWDGCELWTGSLIGGDVVNKFKVVGGSDEAIFQPEWSPGGRLHFVSDRSGWWNLYSLPDTGDHRAAEALYESDAEFATPAWIFGMRTYDFAPDGGIICAYTRLGSWKLGRLETDGKLSEFDLPYSDFSSVRVGDGFVILRAGSAKRAAEIVRVELVTGEAKSISRPSQVEVAEENLSDPEAIEFPTDQGGKSAHAFFYPPANEKFAGPEGHKPPLLVKIHGGPTGATSATLNMGIQYWTSRGIAVVDVNYGGSTGYGREYRRRLNGRWGIVDVDDCISAVRFLVAREDVDDERLAIDGGSAGGFTTLSALTFRNTFGAGASYYGVSDLEALARDTHKFESRYLDGLIAPYPDRSEVWAERSPINHVGLLNCPVILFQGLEDKVVPPNQAEMMVDALMAKGLPVAYVAYEGEQHGFRQAANIKRTLEAELYFYSQIFGFDLAEAIEPVPIKNLY